MFRVLLGFMPSVLPAYYREAILRLAEMRARLDPGPLNGIGRRCGGEIRFARRQWLAITDARGYRRVLNLQDSTLFSDDVVADTWNPPRL